MLCYQIPYLDCSDGDFNAQLGMLAVVKGQESQNMQGLLLKGRHTEIDKWSEVGLPSHKYYGNKPKKFNWSPDRFWPGSRLRQAGNKTRSLSAMLYNLPHSLALFITE